MSLMLKNSLFADSGKNNALKVLSELKVGTNALTTSEYNTTGMGVKLFPKGIIALIYLLNRDGRDIGVAKTSDGTIAIEISGVHSGNRYGIFVYEDDTVSTGTYDANYGFIAQQIPAEYIVIAEIFALSEKNSTFATHWQTLRNEYEGNNLQKVPFNTSSSYIMDALYFGIEKDFPNFDITNPVPTKAKTGFKDITSKFFNEDGTFNHISIETPVVTDTTGSKISIASLQSKYASLTQSFFDTLTEDEKALIPSVNDFKGYNIPEELLLAAELIENAIVSDLQFAKFVAVVGAKGGGKTMLCLALACIFRLPVRTTQGHADIVISDIIGGTTAIDGVLNTSPKTPLIETCDRGGVWLYDDASYAPTAINTSILSVTGTNYQITDCLGKVHKRHPMSFVFLTANIEEAGCNELNEALESRSFIYLNNDDFLVGISEDERINALIESTGYKSLQKPAYNLAETKTLYKQLLGLHEKVITHIEQSHMYDAVLPDNRSLVAWLTQTVILGDPLLAAKMRYLPAVKTSADKKQELETILKLGISKKLYKRKNK